MHIRSVLITHQCAMQESAILFYHFYPSNASTMNGHVITISWHSDRGIILLYPAPTPLQNSNNNPLIRIGAGSVCCYTQFVNSCHIWFVDKGVYGHHYRHCAAYHKDVLWQTIISLQGTCTNVQTMSHIVNHCPLTRIKGSFFDYIWLTML